MAYPELRRILTESLRDTRPPEHPLAGARRAAAGDLPPALKGFLPRRILPAAVLVPILDRPERPGIVLTQRTAHLAQHAGQVSFPGGRLEERDATLLDCALRETEEETGISRRQVTPLGYLDVYLTRTGYAVTPVVGLVDPAVRYRPDPFEVAEIFELPLEVALDVGRYRRETREFHGHQVDYLVLQHEGFRIWGATAAMLYAFQQRINRELAALEKS